MIDATKYKFASLFKIYFSVANHLGDRDAIDFSFFPRFYDLKNNNQMFNLVDVTS